MKKTLTFLTLVLLFVGCENGGKEPKECNCGIIKSQGFLPYATPGYTKFIQNECTGNQTTFYFRTGGGTSIGDRYCLSKGTTW